MPFCRSDNSRLYRCSGFTLAELLIALAILGVIATFAIPKVLNAQQNSTWKANAKEVAATISGAYQAYKLENTPTSSVTGANLTPYMNYVKTDTSLGLDNRPGLGTTNCSSTWLCVHLHNGGTVQFDPESFGGTDTNNFFTVMFDPDGKQTGNEDSVKFLLYYNGKITTRQNAFPNSYSSDVGPLGPLPGADPPWFNWD